MDREDELNLGFNLTIALAIFAIAALALLTASHINSPIFHSILDTSIFLTSGLVAMLFWDVAARTGEGFARALAVTFSILALSELLHTVAALEALSDLVIWGLPETRWRAGTWGPNSHLLPIAVLAIMWLPRRFTEKTGRFAAALFILTLLMLVAFELLPRYADRDAIGFGRPSLVLSPILWAIAGVVCWWRRENNDITGTIAVMSIILVITNFTILFSRTANDAAGMTAHVGMLLGRLFMLIALLQMGSIEMVKRVRAQRALTDLNKDLDRRVGERTAELETTNFALTAENSLREQAERRLQTQLDRLNLLDRITRAIGERQDLQSIFQVVIRSLEDQLPIDFGCIGLYDKEAHVLTVSNVGVKSRPLAIELAMPEKARIPIDQNGLSRCVGGQLVYEPDISYVGFPFPEKLASGGLRALVIVPLMVEREVFGVLIAARREERSFSSSDCEFLKQLSEHVALAAHQAQLRGTLQKAYDELRQTQQAVMQQERLRALGQMASGIAHDINNAISPMALYTDSLLSSEPDLSPRTRSHLETVRRVVDDVQATVARMREFYRGRDAQLVLLPVNLNVLVEQVVDLTRARWGDMPLRSGIVIDVRKELQDDLPAALGIESEIREALTNLIFNAVDAMPHGGQLTIRTLERGSAWLDSPTPAQRDVLIEIVDTGVGMDEHVRRRCLEPFFTTKGERGTGLGLAMVYGVMQRHNAELEIDSAPGKGSTFRIVFPIVAEATAAIVGTPTEEMIVPPLHILVVDDDPVILDSMRLVLEVEGHTVGTASDGRAGVDAFRTVRNSPEPYDVVISDLGMPYMDGNEVARSIKQISAATPVILLTGWGQRIVGDRDFPAHVDRMLSKPPKLQELREALFTTLPRDKRG